MRKKSLDFFYYGTDMIHINDIISRFSTLKMKQYPFSSVFRHKIYLRYIKRLPVFKPLNYVPYIKMKPLDCLFLSTVEALSPKTL